MKKDRLRNLFEKYLTNTCSESELEEMLGIIKRADHEPEIKDVLSEFWNEISVTGKPGKIQLESDDEKWFHEIYSQAVAIEESESAFRKSENVKTVTQHSRITTKSNWFKAAAIILASVVGSLFYAAITNDFTVKDEVAYEVKAPGAGEKIRFTLSDGTQVHLNSESTLKYPKAFDGTSREVVLEGEAYFVVSRDEDKPFMVHSNGLTTRVLGTSFNVRSYSEESDMIVAVSSGRVALTNQQEASQNREVVLEANQWANYSHGNRNFEKNSGDISAYTAWNEGVLLYIDENLGNVASQLERWYGVNISFQNDALKDCVIRGEHRDESLVNVLSAITYAFNIDYEIEERNVTLMGGGCN